MRCSSFPEWNLVLLDRGTSFGQMRPIFTWMVKWIRTSAAFGRVKTCAQSIKCPCTLKRLGYGAVSPEHSSLGLIFLKMWRQEGSKPALSHENGIKTCWQHCNSWTAATWLPVGHDIYARWCTSPWKELWRSRHSYRTSVECLFHLQRHLSSNSCTNVYFLLNHERVIWSVCFQNFNTLWPIQHPD